MRPTPRVTAAGTGHGAALLADPGALGSAEGPDLREESAVFARFARDWCGGLGDPERG